MTPTWLTVVAWLYLSVCFCCASAIAYDIVVNRRRQHMGIMNFVYPITALYFGPAAVAFYRRWARAAPQRTASAIAAPMASAPLAAVPTASAGDRRRHDDHASVAVSSPAGEHYSEQSAGRRKPGWVSMAIEVSHCGSGCALG